MIWGLLGLAIVLYVLVMPLLAFITSRRSERVAVACVEEMRARQKQAQPVSDQTEAPPQTAAGAAALKKPGREQVAEAVKSSVPPLGQDGKFFSAPAPPPAPIPSGEKKPAAIGGWELRLGGNWSMWVGAAALMAGAVMLVRYLVDVGFFSQAMRALLGVVLGIALVAVAEWLRRTGRAPALPGFPAASLSAALAAGGLGAIYASIFTAMSWYGLIGPTLGFAALVLVSGAAVTLSLWHGAMLAIVGIAGAYAVPILAPSPDPSAWGLFGYLAVLAIAAQVVSRRGGWLYLQTLPPIGSAVWLIVWFSNAWQPGDGLVVALYLAVILAGGAYARDGQDTVHGSIDDNILFEVLGVPVTWGRLIDGAMGVLAAFGLFAAVRGDLYTQGTLIAAAAVLAAHLAVAWRDDRQMAQAVLAITSAAALLWTWDSSLYRGALLMNMDAELALPGVYLAALIGASALFIVAGVLGTIRGRRPGLWSATSALAPVVMVAAAHGREWLIGMSGPWLEAALLIALANAATAAWWWHKDKSQHMSAIAAHILGTAAAVCVAAAMHGEEVWLTVALSLSLVVVAATRVTLHERGLDAVLVTIAVGMLARLALDPFPLSDLRGGPLDVLWVVPSYALPAAAFAHCWRVLARHAGRAPLALTEGGAVAFVLMMVAAATQIAEPTLGTLGSSHFMASAINISAALAVTYGLYLGAPSSTSGITAWLWKITGGLASAALLLGPALGGNPVLSHIDMGTLPVLNPLLMAYGAPGVMGILIARAARTRGDTWLLKVSGISGGLLLFGYMNMEIRHAFAGRFLDSGYVGDAEMYAYSAAWIGFSALMMVYGFKRNLAPVRKLALSVVALTIFKVTFVDLGALEGLYRALSFLGLGGSLIALGYVYQCMSTRETARSTRAGT